MRFVEVGDNVRMSVIGLGTWQFGSIEWGYGRDYAAREAVAITHRALDLGVNLVDTAEIYGFGRSERTVAKAIGGRQASDGRRVASRRDEAFVATKVFPVLPLAPVVVQRGRASARRLGVDSIDLYQVHWPNPVVPLGTTMRGMGQLIADGTVRHAGVSNFGLGRWQEAERELSRPVVSNQVEYSLVARGPETDLLPWAQAAGRVVIAYSPLAQGFLSARYDAGNRPGGMRATRPLFLPDNLERAQPLFETLREVAAGHGATAAQVALAWVIRRPNVVAIPGASSVAQVESNVAAAELELTAEEDRALTEASDRFHPRTGLGTLPDVVRARVARR